MPRAALTGQEPPAIAEARAMGMSAAQIHGLRRQLERQSGGMGVWPDNVETVATYLAVDTQWRTEVTAKGMRYLGLDYSACRAGLALAGLVPAPQVWRGVRVMEAAARDALNGEPERE